MYILDGLGRCMTPEFLRIQKFTKEELMVHYLENTEWS